MKNLVIVESPTKAKTISKFLGNDYTIKFSMGHIIDLPKSKVAIAVENNFEPQYEVIEDKKKIIAELKKAAKESDKVILATDPDREGEAIAANLAEILINDGDITQKKSDKISQTDPRKFVRIVFHEITKDAINEALQNPREVDENLVNAQTARRVLDRLVGYKLSPVLWKKVRRGLSAGRVQSVALRLIVEREREIDKFAKEKYWTIHAVFNPAQNDPKRSGTEFELIEINSEKIESKQTTPLYDGEYTITKTNIESEEKALQIISNIKGLGFAVSDINERQIKRSPYPPFTTSTLQQEASRRFGLPGKRTMSLAQKLYEEGHITYHRTDSVSLAPAAVTQIRSFIQSQFGSQYLPEQARLYFTKQKNAQEAHESIRPTNVNRQTAEVRAQLGDQHAKLYELIWNRAVACQMTDAVIESTVVFAESANKVYKFKANGSVLLFDGFLKLTPQALEDKKLPKFVTGENLTLEKIRDEMHETTPPPRYNDASLIKTLEEKGIGRPSTYASIISTITDRGYIERIEKRFEPTPVGTAVNDFLVKNFSTIDDIPFTSQMENDLDEIANGKKEWVAMMKDFYQPFEKTLKIVESADRVKIETETTSETCPLCGSPLIVRFGRFGKFLACSKFPDCKFTKPFVEQTNLVCPKDSGKVIVKKTRKGRKFFGCSNYPKCDFAAWKMEDVKAGRSSNDTKRKTRTAKKTVTKKKTATTKKSAQTV